MASQSINPDNGETLQTFDELTDAQLEKALDISAKSFEAWRHKTFAERAAVSRNAAALLRTRIDEFARLATLEMGKRVAEARGEVALRADVIDHYAENAEASATVMSTLLGVSSAFSERLRNPAEPAFGCHQSDK